MFIFLKMSSDSCLVHIEANSTCVAFFNVKESLQEEIEDCAGMLVKKLSFDEFL